MEGTTETKTEKLGQGMFLESEHFNWFFKDMKQALTIRYKCLNLHFFVKVLAKVGLEPVIEQ